MDLATIEITYRSSKNEETQRTVDVLGFNKMHFEGYCHLRNKTRTFRFDYVESCAETETGEVVTNLFDFLINKLRSYQCRDPYETLAKLMLTENDFMLCLVYIGRLSGQLTPRKKVVIGKACSELSGDRLFSDEQLHFLSNGFDFAHTTEDNFKTAVKNIAKSDSRKRNILLETVRQLSKIPKKITINEVDALKFIETSFPV
ncbi:MAG: hypothetical protein VR65_06170 [Desulfobulbaceae bacterium BRH_c16a]|nr:MAG: hypothetical protein VR65_06170 [Desulfobulbaceae bacterium BRH_c16a]